jgi:hypothetical protein
MEHNRKYKGDTEVYHVPHPPESSRFNIILNIIGVIIGISLIFFILFAIIQSTK